MAGLDNITENKGSLFGGFLDNFKEIGGSFLAYDLAKTQAKSNNSQTNANPTPILIPQGQSSNNTMLLVGGGVAIVVVLILVFAMTGKRK